MKTSCNEFMNRSEILGKRLVILGGGGGGDSRFQVTGTIEWGQKSKPQKTPGPKFNFKTIPYSISKPQTFPEELRSPNLQVVLNNP